MTNTGDNAESKPGHAKIMPSPLNEIPVQIGPSDDSPVKQAAEIPVARAIQTFVLMEARTKAETAELQKRLVMHQFRPCKLYPVLIYHDGLRWVCEYVSMKHQFRESEGIDVVAYGMTPEEATQNFDKLWTGTTDDDESEEESGDEGI